MSQKLELQRPNEVIDPSPRGIIVPMVTPIIYKDGKPSIDEASTKSLLDKFKKAEVGGVFILGNAGSFQFFDLEFKKKYIEMVSSHMKGMGIPLYVGISDKDHQNMIKLAKSAENNGASAVVMLPLFGKGNPKVKVDMVLRNTKLPVIFYDNPDITGGESINPDFVRQCLDEYGKRISGIKYSGSDMEKFKQYARIQIETGGSFRAIMGNAFKITEAINLENDPEFKNKFKLLGAVPVNANIEPTGHAIAFRRRNEIDRWLFRQWVEEYYPSIKDTIDWMVQTNIVRPDSLTFWNLSHPPPSNQEVI